MSDKDIQMTSLYYHLQLFLLVNVVHFTGNFLVIYVCSHLLLEHMIVKSTWFTIG